MEWTSGSRKGQRFYAQTWKDLRMFLFSGPTSWLHSETLMWFQALAWCPWQPKMLASGSGTNDRRISLWNVNMGSCMSSVDTQSQVNARSSVCGRSQMDAKVANIYLIRWQIMDNKICGWTFFSGFFPGVCTQLQGAGLHARARPPQCCHLEVPHPQ